MKRIFALSVGLVFLFTTARPVQADPIQLTLWDGDLPGPGAYGFPYPGNLTLSNYSSSGGSIKFQLSSNSPGWQNVVYPYPPPTFPVNTETGFLIGLSALGSTNNTVGTVLDVGIPVTGEFIGPSDPGPRWSGSYSGTASSVTVFSNPQDVSQLPTPLLDILNHPDHLHLSMVVDGGEENIVDVTMTFDPPAAFETPEPTALATLLVGAAAVLLRHRRRHASR